MSALEAYFQKFREHIVGDQKEFDSPYGKKRIHYADWIASGRLYAPIERKMLDQFGPYVANTHSESTTTGTLMTKAYHYSHQYIKRHVNAGPNDVIITAGYGMTAVINKLMRILSLKGCGGTDRDCVKEMDKPVVFVTHMEHHSNHTSWFETIAEVVQLEPDKDLLVDLDDLRSKLEQYKDRTFKIGSFTACSNVTGILTPIHEMARLMHEYGGLVFVDYAAGAPYMDINMHPEDPLEKLDAIFFSPHKFLGGPGSSGVLIFDKAMYKLEVPDNPGGGTVDWTNPWGKYKYVDDIEAREDGGTPGFLQSIRAALAIELKEQMGVENILAREEELLKIAFDGLTAIPGVEILADNIRKRIGVISFYHPEIHFNLAVKVLNDRYGIQTRGGCACAGTYGHYLLAVSYDRSREITDKISHGDLSEKPGWVRWSLHPTMKDEEVRYFIDAVRELTENIEFYKQEYVYVTKRNEYIHHSEVDSNRDQVTLDTWFSLQ
ncbi:MAG: aminotransferase class V-fold PLP-dependent enzyme [Bacteroidales bacterium]|nr:aminotransferase class V-fold PLP-dependent enzyme [Bacteroidales bacterium]MDT8431826.1 aminotransferase class V-fold PLP-dependent enzyme [Bacteroidales bacterium]